MQNVVRATKGSRVGGGGVRPQVGGGGVWPQVGGGGWGRLELVRTGWGGLGRGDRHDSGPQQAELPSTEDAVGGGGSPRSPHNPP